MPEFLLLLRDNPADFQSWTPEDMQRCVESYRAWSEKLLAENKMVRSEKLRDEGGRHVRRADSGSGAGSGAGTGAEVTVAEGPYTEAREVIGGLFQIRAADYDEAAAIARTCPHLENGWIEIRQIEELG